MNLVEFYNSFTVFGVLAAIAFGILILVDRSIRASKTSKRK